MNAAKPLLGCNSGSTTDDLRRQITILQERLALANGTARSRARSSGQEESVLAPKTPSPKKKPRENCKAPVPAAGSRSQSNKRIEGGTALQEAATTQQLKKDPSQYLAALGHVARKDDEEQEETVKRSSAFSDPPVSVLRRDDSLAIVEHLTLGPKEHPPLPDDPMFTTLEPNSGIYLSERKLSHLDLQEYLRARYHLSPSMLYSVVRLLPSKQGYDVPVEGDWITIAVIVERGPVKMTMASGVSLSEESSQSRTANGTSRGRKFLSLKLADFGHTGQQDQLSKREIKGDAFLNMLLFQADSVSKEFSDGDDSDRFAKRVYKGGSGGAFEACASLKEGTILAILNPKILRPYKRGDSSRDSKPHPRDNILAITPTSAATVLNVGQARDLGFCSAVKKDGKSCGSWLDKRVSGNQGVCEYHFNSAVHSRRSARAEFASSTSGLATSASARQPKLGKDGNQMKRLAPSRECGVDGEAVYMFSGSAIRPGAVDEAVDEKIGRNRQERMKRKREAFEAEQLLENLSRKQAQPSGSLQKVFVARSALEGQRNGTKKHSKVRSANKTGSFDPHGATRIGSDITPGAVSNRSSSYSIGLVKSLGFNPSHNGQGNERPAGNVTQQRLEFLRSASDHRTVKLGSRPGKKIRSGLRQVEAVDTPTPKSLDSDSDLEIDVQ